MRDNKILKPIPEIGKTYFCYDDGKVRPSREYQVKITDVIPYSDIDTVDGLSDIWRANLDQYDHLFDKTDVFLKGISYEIQNEPRELFLARTKSGDWYGLGVYTVDQYGPEGYINSMWLSGLLDVTGEYHKYVLENFVQE